MKTNHFDKHLYCLIYLGIQIFPLNIPFIIP